MVTMSTETRQHYLAAVLAALQPLVLSWVGVVALAILVYTVSASSPLLGEAQWQDAARLGSSLWLMSLGAPMHVAGTHISLFPLGLTLLIVWLCFRFARSAGVFGWGESAACAASGAIVAAVLGATARDSYLWIGALGAAVITGAAALVTWWRQSPPPGWGWELVRRAWRLAWPVLALLAAASLILTVVALVAGSSRIAEIYGYYVLSPVGVVFLTLAQLFYLPTISIWSLAYASGVGFAVGSGASFSSLGSVSEPLPAIPLLGALPTLDVRLPWLIPCLILIGLGIGLWRAGSCARWRDLATDGGVAVAIILCTVALAGVLASGSIGPQRMQETGVTPPLFGAIVALEAGGGLLLGLAARNAQLRQQLSDFRARRAQAAAQRKEERQAEEERARAESGEQDLPDARRDEDGNGDEAATSGEIGAQGKPGTPDEAPHDGTPGAQDGVPPHGGSPEAQREVSSLRAVSPS